jgi:hypothetical protein
MIKYHGTPLTPISIFTSALKDKNCLLPFPRPDNQKLAYQVCNKVILDNGAFTMWTKGKQPNWDLFYDWVDSSVREFFFIPDVIGGTEKENDDLLRGCGFDDGVPVWHISESLDRLERLCSDYDYIAFGSSGEYKTLGTPQWHKRMDEAMRIVCDEDGYPLVKTHMLRCLDPRIFTRYPFHSGDSTNLARNHNRDGWKKIQERIEKYDSPKYYSFRKQNKEQPSFIFE